MMKPLALAAALLSLSAGPAAAQVIDPSMLHGLSAADTKAIRATADTILRTGKVNESLGWSGPTGRAGKVTLLSGGVLAAKKTGSVRVTETKKGKDWTLYTLAYKLDSKGNWVPGR